MQKSITAFICVVAIAAVFGSIIDAAHPMWGGLLSAAIGAYMFHFRTMANDWTNRECWFNFPLAIAALLSFALAGAYPPAQFFFWAFGSAFVGIFIYGMVVLTWRNITARRRS
jgi:hypothetical protein